MRDEEKIKEKAEELVDLLEKASHSYLLLIDDDEKQGIMTYSNHTTEKLTFMMEAILDDPEKAFSYLISSIKLLKKMGHRNEDILRLAAAICKITKSEDDVNIN